MVPGDEVTSVRSEQICSKVGKSGASSSLVHSFSPKQYNFSALINIRTSSIFTLTEKTTQQVLKCNSLSIKNVKHSDEYWQT